MNADHLQLGPGREFDVIRGIAARLGQSAVGLGDDCALVTVGGATLAVSIDASVEGTHFRTDWFTFEDIGWRAAAAALSDLAAEGAKPLGVMVSLGGPAAQEFEAIMSGVGQVVTSVGAKVLGGDLVRSEKYLVDVCALGTCERAVQRSGAQSGDGLWVTGTLGAPHLALRSWRKGQRPSDAIAQRFARPEPRIGPGAWLAQQGATAMIDISDGLAADVKHLAAASQVGIELQLHQVPCVPGADALDAVASGEEYELLVALPAAFDERQARDFQKRFSLPLTPVGRCVAAPGLRLLDRGIPIAVPRGFDHFDAA
jgi:thiamine-monophosphate kinase